VRPTKFGPQPRGRALKLAKDGLTKNEVQAATDHVVGMTDVSFHVNKGETFVLMGLSGSGKSTAIRTVNKLHDITDGRVLVDGTDVQRLTGKDLQAFRRQKMGMVFQHFALFPHRSVIDNTGYGLKVQGVDKEERDAASMEALNLVGLGAFAQSSPSELSGGMQQRVGLARALAADPDILLMDEAFSALDPLIRRQMQDEMMAINQQLKKTRRRSRPDRYARRDPHPASDRVRGRVRAGCGPGSCHRRRDDHERRGNDR